MDMYRQPRSAAKCTNSTGGSPKTLMNSMPNSRTTAPVPSLSAHHDQAAVHRQKLSGDEAGTRAGQKNQYRPHISGGISQRPAERNHHLHLLVDKGAGLRAEEIPQSVGAGSLHRRRQSVDGDIVGGPGPGGGSRPGLHRAL